MKLNNDIQEQTFVVDGGLKTKSFKLDTHATEHLMFLLREGVYKDVITALVREYWCNAKDSVVMAGGNINTDVIIHAPTEEVPYFKVQDFGLGLNEQEVFRYYTQYGASQKRDTDEATGCLGIGCKCAFAYKKAGSFTLTAVKNGVKRIFVASINADSMGNDGRGSMTKVFEEPTDERNGVEISIPVATSDIWQFKEKIASYFKKICASRRPTFKGASFSEISDSKFEKAPEFPESINGAKFYKRVSSDKNANQSMSFIVVMGDVPYNVSYSSLKSKIFNLPMALEVPMGAVDFAVSREDLRYTEKTVNYLNSVVSEFEKAVCENLQESINKCASYPDAVSVLLNSYFFGNDYAHNLYGKYIVKNFYFIENNTKLPVTFYFDLGFAFCGKIHTEDASFYSREKMSRSFNIRMFIDKNGSASRFKTLFIDDNPSKTSNGPKKIRQEMTNRQEGHAILFWKTGSISANADEQQKMVYNNFNDNFNKRIIPILRKFFNVVFVKDIVLPVEKRESKKSPYILYTPRSRGRGFWEISLTRIYPDESEVKSYDNKNISLVKKVEDKSSIHDYSYNLLLNGEAFPLCNYSHYIATILVEKSSYYTTCEKTYKTLLSMGFKDAALERLNHLKKHNEIFDISYFNGNHIFEMKEYLKIRDNNLLFKFEELVKKHTENMKELGSTFRYFREIKATFISPADFIQKFTKDAENHAIFALSFPHLAESFAKKAQNKLDFLKNYVKMIEQNKTSDQKSSQ